MTASTTSTAAEALVAGVPSWSDVQQVVRRALRAQVAGETADGESYFVWIVDMTASHVVYELAAERLWQRPYTVTSEGGVEFGPAEQVARAYVVTNVEPAPVEDVDQLAAAVESAQPGERDHLTGRVLEAKSGTSTGGRVFRVRIIAVGTSLNGTRYTEAVLGAAAPMYEGAKAYDRHRTPDELKSGTIAGLVGHYRNVTASSEGLDADLHLLPSATHAAEVLDAALAAQADGLPPTAGISHDVLGQFKAAQENGQNIREATAITRVFSADVVSDPAAGGLATRVLAGGIRLDALAPHPSAPTGAPTEHQQESTMQPTAEAVLAALRDATPDQLAAAGLARAGESVTAAAPTIPTQQNATEAASATTAAPAVVTHTRESYAGRALVRGMVEDAQLPVELAESVRTGLPEHFTEADVSAALAGVQNVLANVERAGLRPEVGGQRGAQVGRESFEAKRDALDLFFTPNAPGGYRSFTEAFLDITGHRPGAFGGDLARTILRESIMAPFDSQVHVSEALDTTSWPQVLGDSITRRAIAEYQTPNLQTWRLLVSSTPTVTDFREQKVQRVGGYGLLPGVAEGGAYQYLVSPTDEEATYSVGKKGGLEVITWEMIRNDDTRRLSQIPSKLGRAAAQTLYRFVFDMLVDNPTTTYDGVALFHASHGNTASAALNQSNLSAARATMSTQSAYGTATEVLNIEPNLLVVPAALEETAFQLCTSAVAIPSPAAGASNTPNIHNRMSYVKVPYYSNQANWFAVADPNQCPTIEVGFLDGRQEPDFFTQNDPNSGSVFSADRFEIKIRHVYSGTILDHRGLYRGIG